MRAKPHGDAIFTGNNTAGKDLIGIQNNAAGSKPTYQPGSKQATYNVHGNTGPATYGDIKGNSNRVGESSVAAGGGQSGTIKVILPKIFPTLFFLIHEKKKKRRSSKFHGTHHLKFLMYCRHSITFQVNSTESGLGDLWRSISGWFTSASSS